MFEMVQGIITKFVMLFSPHWKHLKFVPQHSHFEYLGLRLIQNSCSLTISHGLQDKSGLTVVHPVFDVFYICNLLVLLWKRLPLKKMITTPIDHKEKYFCVKEAKNDLYPILFPHNSPCKIVSVPTDLILVSLCLMAHTLVTNKSIWFSFQISRVMDLISAGRMLCSLRALNYSSPCNVQPHLGSSFHTLEGATQSRDGHPENKVQEHLVESNCPNHNCTYLVIHT